MIIQPKMRLIIWYDAHFIVINRQSISAWFLFQKNEIEVQTKNLTDLEAQIEVEMAVCAQLKANSKKIEEEINVSKRENQEYTVSLQEKKVSSRHLRNRITNMSISILIIYKKFL